MLDLASRLVLLGDMELGRKVRSVFSDVKSHPDRGQGEKRHISVSLEGLFVSFLNPVTFTALKGTISGFSEECCFRPAQEVGKIYIRDKLSQLPGGLAQDALSLADGSSRQAW